MGWKAAVRRFVEEDVGPGDVTSEALVPSGRAVGTVVAREACVVAGLREAAEVFRAVGARPRAVAKDGRRVAAGKTVLQVRGRASAVLGGERTALNLLARMSGIATATADLTRRVRRRNPRAVVAATRKTAPGLRQFDKRAVALGGGWPHREGLFDAVLIKDNHLRLVDLEEAIRRGRRTGLTVEVEVSGVEDAARAAAAGVDIVMLDNMSPWEARRAFRAVKRVAARTLVEVSGGLTAENIERYAFADILSVGALTHSVRAVDFSMDVSPD